MAKYRHSIKIEASFNLPQGKSYTRCGRVINTQGWVSDACPQCIKILSECFTRPNVIKDLN